MNVVEKRNINVPFLSIESFGIYWKDNGWNQQEHFSKYYVASLDFTIKKFFGTQNKLVYLPVLFTNDKEVKDIMEHYSNIYFLIRFKYGYSGTHYSDLYHISNFVDIEKIYKKEMASMEEKPNAHGIDFVIRDYKGYDIVINAQYSSYGYVDDACSPTDIDALVSTTIGDRSTLNYIKDNYAKFPSIVSYSIKRSADTKYDSIYNVATFEKMIAYIDKLDVENKKREETLGNMYSKKTFKLVEN